jgi:type I restriction enzyme S subunit
LCISIVGANTAATAILGIDACFPDSVIGFNGFEGIADNRFVKYFLEMKRIELYRISLGTARENLSMEKLLTTKISLPPYKTQQKIVSILSAYDDLIENNLKRIKLLEEAAQHIYKE